MATAEQIARWDKILVRGRVPLHYRDVSMATMESLIGEDAIEQVRDYLDHFPNRRKKGRGLYIHGPAQSGKNTVATFVLRRAITLNHMVLYIEAEEARIGFIGREQFDPESLLIDRMKQVDVLCITHLGTERNTEEFTAGLSMLLRSRQGQARPTLLTSYLSPSQVKKRYGVHVASALQQACDIVNVVAEEAE